MKVNTIHWYLLILILHIFPAQSALSQTEHETKNKTNKITLIGKPVFQFSKENDYDPILSMWETMVHSQKIQYDSLSSQTSELYLQKINRSNFFPTEIADIIQKSLLIDLVYTAERVYVETLKKRLNDEELRSIVISKIKTPNITTEDVLAILRSTHLCLPVITKYTETFKKRKLDFELTDVFKVKQKDSADAITISMKGYMLWFKIEMTNEGKMRAVYLPQWSKEHKGEFTAFIDKYYKIKNRAVNGTLYAKLLSAGNWIKSITADIRAYPDFRYSIDVTDKKDYWFYGYTSYSARNRIDDGFNVWSYETDENGNGKYEKTNLFYRIVEINQFTPSKFFGYIAGEKTDKMYLVERPTFPFTLVTSIQTHQVALFGNDIPTTYADYQSLKSGGTYTRTAINVSDITMYLGANVGIELDLARFFELEQFFVGFNTEIGISLNPNPNRAFLIGVSNYFDIKKKFWFGLVGVFVNISPGIDFVYLWRGAARDQELKDYSGSMFGLKIGGGVEFLIQPEMAISIHAGWRFNALPFRDEMRFASGQAVRPYREIKEDGLKVATFDGFYAGISFTLGFINKKLEPFQEILPENIAY